MSHRAWQAGPGDFGLQDLDQVAGALGAKAQVFSRSQGEMLGCGHEQAPV